MEQPALENPETNCKQCGLSLIPLQVINVQRKCDKCDKSVFVYERGPDGNGLQAKEGDNVIIPAGAIRLSLKPGESTGRFFRGGIPIFAKMLFFEGQAEKLEEFTDQLDQYDTISDNFLNNSLLLKDLNLDDENDADIAIERLKNNQETSEWWAFAMGSFTLIVKDALEENNPQKAAWAMSMAVNSHAMLVFKQQLEEVIWRGYSGVNYTGEDLENLFKSWNLNKGSASKKLHELLQLWETNKDNDKEEFWQTVFKENALILTLITSQPMIILKDKAYVGGKGIDGRGDNLPDFLLTNPKSKNSAIVEIKTPKTPLMGNKYRGITNASVELTGSTIQALSYRNTLVKNYNELALKQYQSGGEVFEALNPPTFLIIGQLSSIENDQDKQKFFELHRQNSKDVQILTYDEIFTKVEAWVKLLDEI